MSLTIHDDKVPLRIDESGAVRIGQTRMLFYLVVERFQSGQTPEQISQSFRTLRLEDTYAVIAYYLRHRDEVDAWLVELNREADETRRVIESDPKHQAFTNKLKARMAEMKSTDAQVFGR